MRDRCALLLFGLAGCFQSSGEATRVSQDPGRVCTSCKGTSGGAGGISSGGAASSGGGTSASTSGVGSTSGGAAGGTAGATAGGSSSGGSLGSGGSSGGALTCPEVYIEARLFDGIDFTPIVGANVEALDDVGVTLVGSAALTDSNGVGKVCVPRGVQATFAAQATGYPATYLETVVLSSPWILGLPSADGGSEDGGSANGLPLLSDNTLNAIAFVLVPALDMSKPVVLISLDTADPESPCRSQKAGWQIGVRAADGGVIPDGGYVEVYMGAYEIPDPTATSTTVSGVALVYDIDPAITSLTLTPVNTNADAGDCPLENSAIGLTGQVDTNEGEVTYAPILMP